MQQADSFRLRAEAHLHYRLPARSAMSSTQAGQDTAGQDGPARLAPSQASESIVRRLRLLLLLLLLQLLLTLLHLLQNLLRSAPLSRLLGLLRLLRWSCKLTLLLDGRFRLLRLLDVFLRILFPVLILLDHAWLLRSSAGLAPFGSEHELARSSLALIPNHQHVVPRALQQLAEYIPRGSRSVAAVNALIGADPFHLHSGGRRNILQHLPQAGVGSRDA